jgi:hypothetical protein
MSKYLLLIVLLLLLPGVMFAQSDPFLPPTPVTIGQGGAFTANAEGMNSFFYNPAGFARDGEFTLLSVTPWVFMDRSLLDFILETTDIVSSEPRSISFDSRQSEEDETVALLEQFGLTDEAMTGLGDIGTWAGDLTPEQQTAAITAIVEDEALAQQYEDAGVSIEDIKKIVEDPESSEEDFQNALGGVLVTILSNPELLETTLTSASDGAEQAGAQPIPKDSLAAVTNALDPETNPNMPSGNMRVGGQLAMGYVGHGFGLGAFVTADAQFRGKNLFATRGRVINTITLAGGFAIPIGPITLGAQVRPTFMGYSDVNPSKMIQSFQNGFDTEALKGLIGDVYTGFRIGVDVGVLWDIGPLTLGAAIKDIIPFKLQRASKYSGEEYIQELATGNLPLGTGMPIGEDEDLYNVPPMKINVGASFHPDLGGLSVLLDPRISVDVRDLLGLFRLGDEAYLDPTVWDFINLGAEIKFLRFASLRAGMYDGYLTLGAGAHLLFLDINAAVAVSEFDVVDDVAQFKNIGFSLEVAVRF